MARPIRDARRGHRVRTWSEYPGHADAQAPTSHQSLADSVRGFEPLPAARTYCRERRHGTALLDRVDRLARDPDLVGQLALRPALRPPGFPETIPHQALIDRLNSLSTQARERRGTARWQPTNARE